VRGRRFESARRLGGGRQQRQQIFFDRR
jgi:hypothetical protein